jgi:hypothetical protein
MVKELFNIYKKKSHFERDLASGVVTPDQVAVVADSSEIWASGEYIKLLQEQEQDNSYTITSFTLYDISQSEGSALQVDVSPNDLQFGALSDAIREGKTIYIKLADALDASAPMLYCYEDDFIYCAVYNPWTFSIWELEITNIVTIKEVTGGYKKTSTGIPKSDLASTVQMSLDKADSAVQEGTFGDLHLISISGFEGRREGLVYALPHEATGDEDDVFITRSTVKTINGENIYGQGDISISGNGYRVEERSAVSSLSMEANKVYVVRSAQRSVSISSLLDSGKAVDNVWILRFPTSSTTTTKTAISFSVLWKDGIAFSCPQEDTICELVFRKSAGTIIGEWSIYK